MPKINIYESDLTSAGGLDSSSNTVYIPGFVYAGANNGVGTYRINSVSEFKETFKDKNTGKFRYLKVETKSDKSISSGYNYVTAERSQQYALAVLSVGLPIVFDVLKVFDSEYNTEDKYKNDFPDLFTDALTKLTDRNSYSDLKFITSGGYANYGDGNELCQTMIDTIAGRQDCIALIDHEESTTKKFINDGTYDAPNINSQYGAMFTPWCTFQFSSHEAFSTTTNSQDGTIINKLDEINMPGSLAYLLAFGTSISNNNANWLAAAGASRGTIPYLVAPLVELSESDIDAYQLSNNEYIGTAINPIATINPYGTIVWGNRTLYKGTTGLVASSFLNIRHLANDIKKTLYTACKAVTFEQNSDLLWIKFKSLMTPLLDQMQTGNGISGYKLTKKKSTKKATLTAVLRIYPIEAVENFEITLELADESTDVTDNL